MNRVLNHALHVLLLLQGYGYIVQGESYIEADHLIVQSMFAAQDGNASTLANAWTSSTGIRCAKVHEIIVSFSDQTEAIDYMCERHANNVKGVARKMFPLINLPDDFNEVREHAMQQGNDNLYIPGAVLAATNQVVLPSKEETALMGLLPLTWFADVDQGASRTNEDAVYLTGWRKSLIVRVTANGIAPGPTANELTDAMFGTAGVANQYKECSNNQLKFGLAKGNTSTGLTITKGLVEVDVGNTVDKDVFTLTEIAKDKIGDRSTYLHLLFVVPYQTTYGTKGDDWYAFANRPGDDSYYGSNGSQSKANGGIAMLSKSATMHEIGHNLGLQHSGKDAYEYGDGTCQMGSSSSYYDNRCFNGAKLAELEWYDEQVEMINPTTESFHGKVIGVNDLRIGLNSDNVISDDYTLVVGVKNPNDTGTNYYLWFNVDEGMTADTAVYKKEVIVTEATPQSTSWSESSLVAHLTPTSNTYTIANYKGDRNLVFQVNTIGTSGSINYADVSIQLDVSTCSSNANCNDLDACTTDTCVNEQCVYTLKNGCCGNDVCEAHAGETCTSCPNDCSAPTDCGVLQGGSGVSAIYEYTGFMFAVQAKKKIFIQRISFYSFNSSQNKGFLNVSIYGKAGNYEGSQLTPNKWELLTDSVRVTGVYSNWSFGGSMKVYLYDVPLTTLKYLSALENYSFYISTNDSTENIVFSSSGATSSTTLDVENDNLATYDIQLMKSPIFSYKSWGYYHRRGDIMYGFGEPLKLSAAPSSVPTAIPSHVPSSFPSSMPSRAPSSFPSSMPSRAPSSFPSSMPSLDPSSAPITVVPTISQMPSLFPTASPTGEPSVMPTSIPSDTPSSTPTASPTMIPTSSPSDTPSSTPTASPSMIPTSSPSDTPSSTPTTSPSLIPTSHPTSSPTVSQSPSSSPTVSQSPSSSPSVSPSSTPSLPSYGPFRILSGLSTNKSLLCLVPKNYALAVNTVMQINKCKPGYSWSMDHKGRIILTKDPTLCLQFQGKAIKLKKCNNNNKQKFMYNYKKRLISMQNGTKAMSVNSANIVKLLPYAKVATPTKEMWNIKMDGKIVPVPTIDTFQIKSSLTTNGKQVCIFTNGKILRPTPCQNNNKYKWKMDNHGRISSVNYPTKCIQYNDQNIKMALCVINKDTQRWSYSVFDGRLASLRNGTKQVTVAGGVAKFTAKLQLLVGTFPPPAHEKWVLQM